MKKIISVLFITIICLIFVPNKNLAVLQSNGNTPAGYGANDYILNVRKMENLSGAMGLSETLNEDLTPTTSNNIDVHMEKNTEYGAMAILSASSYGNPNIIKDGETTTGNKTGIVYNNKEEWTAVSSKEKIFGVDSKFSKRYSDYYEEPNYVAKKGDAIVETNKWHNAEQARWFRYDGHTANLFRAKQGIFSYNGIIGYSSYTPSDGAYINFGYATRAVVVCGQGL